MFVVDLNQILIANFFVAVGPHTHVEIDERLVRSMALNTLRSINMRFRNKYGSMVIASDSISNWRKEYFPFYKAARKKTRDHSDIDWKQLFLCMDRIKDDLQTYFPYKFIQIERAEADDIIAVIVKATRDEEIVIISGDKDFKQLQKYDNVKQYEPFMKKWITESNPRQHLLDHILTGDRSDGVPNILSDDNVFVLNLRQRVLTKRRKDELQLIGNRPDDKYYSNWIRNKTLIDLEMIPDDIKESILDQFKQQPRQSDSSQLLPYMIKHGMSQLMEKVSDF